MQTIPAGRSSAGSYESGESTRREKSVAILWEAELMHSMLKDVPLVGSLSQPIALAPWIHGLFFCVLKIRTETD